jgi:hypothetical protein
MHVLEYLIYHLRPYGISHNVEALQSPDLPTKPTGGGVNDTAVASVSSKSAEEKKTEEAKVEPSQAKDSPTKSAS